MFDIPFAEPAIKRPDSIAPELVADIVIEFFYSESFECPKESKPMINQLCKDITNR